MASRLRGREVHVDGVEVERESDGDKVNEDGVKVEG